MGETCDATSAISVTTAIVRVRDCETSKASEMCSIRVNDEGGKVRVNDERGNVRVNIKRGKMGVNVNE